MISGRLKSSSSTRRPSHKRKDRNVNYLVWTESEVKKLNQQNRSESLSQNGRIGRNSEVTTQSNDEKKLNESWSVPNGGSDKKLDGWESSSDAPNEDFQLLLNIGGKHFIIRYSTLKYRCPNSLLTQFAQKSHEERLEACDGYQSQTQEYFFERSGFIFESIYDFLTTGHLHRPMHICRDRLYREIEYWKIGSGFFAPCCACSDEESEDDDAQRVDSSADYGDEFDTVQYGSIRRSVWLLMEEPSSGTWAKVFALASIFMIIISVCGMILGSLTEFQSPSGNKTESGEVEMKPGPFVENVELICIIWFTIEYIARFAVCTKKCKFIFEPLNMIDSFTIIPFFIEIILSAVGFGGNTIGDFRGIAMIMRVVRVMRVARVFKLARYSNGLKSFGMTVKTSLPELSMLMLFLVTAIIFFSTLMYFAERDEHDTKFRSIPLAGWWCIVTMTTVGYGDFTPKTVFGRIIASCASISGVLVLAFPITMIVENFSKTYDTEKNDFKTVQRKRRMAKAYA